MHSIKETTYSTCGLSKQLKIGCYAAASREKSFRFFQGEAEFVGRGGEKPTLKMFKKHLSDFS